MELDDLPKETLKRLIFDETLKFMRKPDGTLVGASLPEEEDENIN